MLVAKLGNHLNNCVNVFRTSADLQNEIYTVNSERKDIIHSEIYRKSHLQFNFELMSTVFPWIVKNLEDSEKISFLLGIRYGTVNISVLSPKYVF